jgi:hypothetical protein
MYLIEILPSIWISNKKVISDKFLKERKIHHFIDCEKDMKFFEGIENYIEAIKNQIKISKYQMLQKYLIKIIEEIYNMIIEGKSLIIYDPNGNKKAPVIIIAFLMKYGKLNPVQAVDAYNSKSKLPLNIEYDYKVGLKTFYDNLVS